MQKESAVSSGNLRTQKGLTTSRSLGINATYDWQRVKFRSNIQYVGTDRLEDSRTTVDNFLRQDKSITQSTGRNRLKNNNLIANAFLEWKMDSVTTLTDVTVVSSKGGGMMFCLMRKSHPEPIIILRTM